MRDCRRWMFLARVSLFVSLILAVAPTAQAAEWKLVTEKTRLKKGDKVLINHHGQWVDGKVEELQRSGRVRVRFHSPIFKREMTWPASRDQLRLPVTSRRTGSSGSRSKQGNPFELGSGNPFEPDKGFRTWQDDTGQFKMEAELVEIQGDAVRLKRRDGRVVTVPLDRLGEEDRRFVQGLQGQADEGGAGGEEEEQSEEDEDILRDNADFPAKRAQWNDVASVYLSADVKPSGLEPDGGMAVPGLTKRPVSLPPKSDFFDGARGLFVAAAAPHRVMLPFSRTNQHNQPTRIVLCDLKQGSQGARSLRFPTDAIAEDLGPSGQRVLSCPNGFGFGSKARVDVWGVESGKLKHELGWKPYQGEGHGSRDNNVDWAAFVDEDHVLTCGSFGKLGLWKLPEVRAVYSMKITHGTQPALSPGRKYLAAMTEIGLVVLDAKTGDLKGHYKGGGKQGTIAFRPDGKRIALGTSKRLTVWEFPTGELYRDIGLPVEGLSSSKIAWPSRNYVLVGGRYLVDLEQAYVLWDYQGGSMADSISRQFWCLCGEGNSLALVPQPLPHKEAERIAQELKPEDVRAIEPGATVSLEVRVSAPPDRQRQIEAFFEEQLKARGMKVEPGQALKLLVCTKLGETETIEYVQQRGFIPRPPMPFGGRSGDGKIIHFRQQISQVAFLVHSETAWENSSTVRAPGNVQLEEGETTEQAVRKHEKPNLDFFDHVQIPSYVAQPSENVSFGASKLTPNGLRPAEIQRRKPKGQQRPSATPTNRQT